MMGHPMPIQAERNTMSSRLWSPQSNFKLNIHQDLHIQIQGNDNK